MPVPLSGSSRCDLRCVTRCPCKSVYHSIARVGEGMRCHQALPTTHAVTGAGGRNSRRHLISRQTNSSFVRPAPGGAREIETCKVASEDREVALENLSGRVDEVVKEAVDIARQIKELEELGPRETGISNDELDEVKKKLLAFLELSFLPENALDLLTAAGYIRQDEWHLLYDKQKQRQKEAKDRREENYYKVIQHVLSGERERNVESDMRSKESQGELPNATSIIYSELLSFFSYCRSPSFPPQHKRVLRCSSTRVREGEVEECSHCRCDSRPLEQAQDP